MFLLALDPGKNTGWAFFNTDSPEKSLQRFDTCRNEIALYAFLETFPPNIPITVVLEDYVIRSKKYGGKDHEFDKGQTLRVIGAIEHWCWLHKHDLKYVQPTDKPAAYGHVGLTYVKGKKNMHHMDAVVHGFEYMLKHEIIPAKNIYMCMAGNSGTK